MNPAREKKDGSRRKSNRTTLKTIAAYLKITPGTVSAALNNSAAARSIPEHTKERIRAVARELNYRPNFVARSLRLRRSFTIGVIAEKIGDVYGSQVISGIEKCLSRQNYLFLTVTHRHDPRLLETYSHLLEERGVEGIITVDTSILTEPSLPTVAIAGHRQIAGVTNIVLDHKRAAWLALEHLRDLGHEEIAFLQGHVASSDSEDRWKAISEVADELGIRIRPELTVRIESADSRPEVGIPVTNELLARGAPFTALFAYNDISAIGALWALRDAGLRVPQDVSVVGLDDIPEAALANPGLTTVQQPLRRMGEIAAEALVSQIEESQAYLPKIVIEPELVIRKSTARLSLRGDYVPVATAIQEVS